MIRDLVLSIKAEAVKRGYSLDAAKVTSLIANLNKELNGQSNARSILQPLSTEELAFLLYNLGKISRFSRALLDANALSHIVKELRYSRSISSKMIANAFYGLGLIAKNKRLEGIFSIDTLAPMLTLLLSSNPNSQSIANTIYALGELAKAGRLQGMVTVAGLAPMLTLLLSGNPSSQNIANTIYALGELAKAGRLDGVVTVAALAPMLTLLLRINPNSQEVANTIYALSELAKAGRLQGVVTESALAPMLTLLLSSNPNSQGIANTIYALGEMAKVGQLQGVVTVAALAPMLTLLLSSNPNSQDVANTIYALGELAHSNHLPNSTTLPLSEMLATLNSQNPSHIDLRQLLKGLSKLQYQDAERLNELFNAVLNVSYLHPNEVINLLGAYAGFSSNHTSLNPEIFECLLDGLNLTFAQCNAARQRDLGDILTQLPAAQKNALNTKLGLQAPVVSSIKPILRVRNTQAMTIQHSPEWDMAYQNQLFRLIADKNIPALERLLDVERFLPTVHQTPRGRGNTSFFAEPRAPRATQPVAEVVFDGRQTANAMVARFLQNTPAVAFKKLISESSHDYFERLLYACGKHMQYQFAIGHDLNPIILYLPLKELERMVNALIRLGFYQDHRAILALVEALFLRKQLHQADAEALTQLQYLLLDKAILFHSQHHHIVTPKLREQRLLIEGQNEQLHLDEDEEQEEQTTSSAITEQSSSVPAPAAQISSSRMSAASSSLFVSPARAATFQEESLVLSNGQPNMQAYYTSEHVHQLLEKKLNGKASFHLLAPLDYHQAPSGTNLRAHLLNFLGNNHVDDNIHLIVPICINLHWVAVKLLVQQGNVNIAYYDSVKNQTRRNLVMDATEKAVRDIYQPLQLMSEDKTYYFQDDASSCGAYLVENIAKHVLNRIGKKHVTTLAFRENHIEILGLQTQQATTNKRVREEDEQEDGRQKKRCRY